MNVLLFAALFTTVFGFAISNLMLLSAEVDAMHNFTYQRLIPIKKSIKKWKPKTKTAERQSARRSLFRRHHQQIKKTI